MKDGGPAFPEIETTQDILGGVSITQRHTGMSLRDYFAGQAMRFTLGASADFDGVYNYQSASVHAYAAADAMIAQREKD